jgi:hypothetical protein
MKRRGEMYQQLADACKFAIDRMAMIAYNAVSWATARGKQGDTRWLG